MKTFDMWCKVVGGTGAIIVGIGFLYICFMMTFGLDNAIPSPRMIFAGLTLMLASMLVYGGVHLIRGDL